jgi:hypothetical protein
LLIVFGGDFGGSQTACGAFNVAPSPHRGPWSPGLFFIYSVSPSLLAVGVGNGFIIIWSAVQRVGSKYNFGEG